MTHNNRTPLCHYHYDPLDRMSHCAQADHDNAQRFYVKDRLTTEIQGVSQHCIFQHGDFLLAQQRLGVDGTQTILVASDRLRSVLNELNADGPHGRSYTPYGHRDLGGLLGLLGFNGERPDPVTGHYLLGNGYRAFNPVLMRFNSPDSWSPFGEGGLNAYAYCLGDPVNRMELDGHSSILGALRSIGRNLGLRTSRRAVTPIIESGPMKDVKVLSDGVVQFDSLLDGKRTLNIEAHGNKPSFFKKATIASDGKKLDPAQFYSLLKSNRTDINLYDNIHLPFCYSGNGGGGSFAGTLSKLTNKPVDGYIGPIGVSRSKSPLKEYELRKLQNENLVPFDTIFEGKTFAIDPSHTNRVIRFKPR